MAKANNWRVPTATEFTLKSGSVLIAIRVHDAELGAADIGGFLADIILGDKPKYIGDSGWKCDVGKPINSRKDNWQKTKFNDGKWIGSPTLPRIWCWSLGFWCWPDEKHFEKPGCPAK